MRRVGPYELVAELGSGGLGQVWRARDAAGREVALKLLLRDASQLSGPERERFLREGQALLRVRDPGLVALVDHGLQERLPWLAMELIPGETLAARLRAGPFAPVRALEVTLELARTLSRLHAAGVIHRDLKPHNVMLRPEPGGAERAVLLDLGLVHLVDLQARLTRTGEIVGTPGYMSPEQAAGEPIGAAADVYGLGAVLYALLCGGPPFQGTPMEVISGVLTKDPPPPSRRRPGLTRELDELVLRCLCKSPTERPELPYLCQELDRLRRLAASEATGRPSHPGAARPRQLALGLLTIGAAVSGGLWLARPAPPPLPASAPEPPTVSLPAEDRARLARQRSEDLIAQARQAREAGDGPRATALLEQAVGADPEHAYAWYALGLAVSQGGAATRERALQLLERSLALDPSNARANHQRALTLFDLGRRDEALQALDWALKLDPSQSRTWSVRAILRQQMGDRERAWTDITRAAELAPDDPGVMSDLGLILRQRGEPTGALRAWNAALARDPDLEATLERRAALLVELGRRAEAEADYDHLLRLRPRSAQLWHDRAVLRWQMQHTAGAREDYARAVELDPSLAGAWWGHAKTGVLLEEYRSAAESYQRYLELAPDGPGAAEAREFLTKLQEAARQGG